MERFDPFVFYRTALFVGLAIWTTGTMMLSALYWWRWFQGETREKRLARAYAQQLLVSARVKPLMGELVQIVFWTVLLVLLWYAHTLLGGSR